MDIARNFLFPKGEAQPLFQDTMFTNGDQVVTSTSLGWKETTYNVTPSTDFLVGDSAMWNNQLVTISAYDDVGYTILTADNEMQLVDSTDLRQADWTPPDTFVLSDLQLLQDVNDFLYKCINEGCRPELSDMPFEAQNAFLFQGSVWSTMPLFIEACTRLQVQEVTDMLVQWELDLTRVKQEILLGGCTQRIVTIESAVANFGEKLDKSTLVDIIQRNADDHMSKLLTEFEIAQLEPSTMVEILNDVDFTDADIMVDYLTDVIDDLKSLTESLPSDIYRYIWGFRYYDMYFQEEFLTQLGDLWGLCTSPFPMFQYGDGIRMIEDIAALAEVPSMTLNPGDKVTVFGSVGVVGDGPFGEIPAYTVTFRDGDLNFQVFDIETLAEDLEIGNKPDRLIRPDVDPDENYELVFDNTLHYARPIWYTDTPEGRVHYWKDWGTIFMLPSTAIVDTVPDLQPMADPAPAPKDTVFEVDTPMIGVATVALVGAILWIEL